MTMPARVMLAILGVAVAVVLGTPSVPVSARGRQDPITFRGRADSVNVDVAVRRGGRPVAGLTVADFELLDSGVAQEISEISYEKLPIDVAMVLDVSASVTGPALDQLRRSMTQLRSDLAPQDRMKLMAFNMRVTQLVDYAQPPADVDAALASISAGGSSSIFDTLAVALAAPAVPDRRNLIVLFSDGEDSSSVTDTAALLDVAHRTTPTVAVVLASTLSTTVSFRPTPTAADLAFRRVYDRLAADTGGMVVAIGAGDNLTSTFRRVLDEFRSSYVLHFVPRGVNRTGFHPLTVKVKRAEGLEIRARSGYTMR